MHRCFGRWTRWLEKLATSIQNGVYSIASTLPFQAAVLYRFRSSERCLTEIRRRAFVMTGTRHWMFGGIVRV